jgi:hypothetical protein
VQTATGDHVEVAFADQGYTGAQAAEDAAAHGIVTLLPVRSSWAPRDRSWQACGPTVRAETRMMRSRS